MQQNYHCYYNDYYYYCYYIVSSSSSSITHKQKVSRNMMQFPWVGLLEVPQKPQLKPVCVSLPSVATAVEVKLPRQPKQIETKHTASTINFI